MNWDEFRRRFLPHILIIVSFIVITFVFLSPMLKGKVLPQNDVRQWKGSFHETETYLKETGKRTLWTNSMFGGMPTYQIAPYSPNSMIGTIAIYNVLVSGWGLPMPANAIFLYCLSFYLLLLAFRVNPWLAMAGALAYAFSAFNIVIIEAGHMLQAYALGTAPLVLAAAVYTIRWRKFVLGGALFAVALAIHLRTNHPQISYYTAILLTIYLLSELINHIREKRLPDFLKGAGIFAVGAALAIGSTATFLITTEEYSKETIRGKSELTRPTVNTSTGLDRDYAFSWSYGQGETFTILIPDFRGGASGAIGEHNPKSVEAADANVREYVRQMDEYWGVQPFASGPVYCGAVICLLFVLGLVFLRGPDRWWILAATVIAIMLSWGRTFPGFNNWMFDHFPLYNKFRSVLYTLVIAEMVVPLLAVLALDRLLKNQEWNKVVRKRFLIASGALAALCLIFFLMPSLGGDFHKPEEERKTTNGQVTMVDADRNALMQGVDPAQQKDPQVQQQVNAILDGVYASRADILHSDALRSFIFIVLAAALLYFYFDKKIKREWVYAGIGLLILIDLFSVCRRYLNEKTFVNKTHTESNFFQSDADAFILQDKDPDYRVVNVDPRVGTFQDATTSYYHKSVGGYHGAKLRRIQDLIENQLGDEVALLQQNISKSPGPALLDYMQQRGDLGVLNMLNTKYILFGETRNEVVENKYALGHAWFVRSVRMVPNADAEIKAMTGFNPHDTALVDVRFGSYMQGFAPAADTTGTITMNSYKPDELTYSTNSPTEQFAVFSEVYYNSGKGWNAYLDGKKVEHVRADFLLRAMRIPAGRHEVVFKFEPASFARGETITLISSLGLIIALLGGIFFEWRQRRKVLETKAA